MITGGTQETGAGCRELGVTVMKTRVRGELNQGWRRGV